MMTLVVATMMVSDYGGGGDKDSGSHNCYKRELKELIIEFSIGFTPQLQKRMHMYRVS